MHGAVFAHGSSGYGSMLFVGDLFGLRCCEKYDAVCMAAVGLDMFDSMIDLRRGYGGESQPLVEAPAIQDSSRRPYEYVVDVRGLNV